MKHIINGCGVNLRTLTEAELSTLIEGTEARAERVQEELDSLRGEQVRRSHPTQLQLQYDGPAVA